MRTACPSIVAIEGALNGLGLLQAVQHFALTGKTMTFNFVHFSIQEFLAAYHITQFPPDKELQVLKAKFWSDSHSNMFSMYISLTNGQRSAFKEFLSGGNDTIAIDKIFLQDQLKCLHLFFSFHEANDKAMCTSIQQAQIFNNKAIDLRLVSLSPYDIECVTLFLRYNITFTLLNLWGNNLTRSSSSFISDLTIHCKVEVLNISYSHTIGEDPALYNMLSHPSSKLLTLDTRSTSLSSYSAIVLFTALVKRNQLQQLYINKNLITDEACDFIATTMKNNSSLVKLRMHDNKISGEAAQRLLQSLQLSNILQELWLPSYTEDVKERIKSLQQEVNKNRESRGCQTKLNIMC